MLSDWNPENGGGLNADLSIPLGPAQPGLRIQLIQRVRVRRPVSGLSGLSTALLVSAQPLPDWLQIFVGRTDGRTDGRTEFPIIR